MSRVFPVGLRVGLPVGVSSRIASRILQYGSFLLRVGFPCRLPVGLPEATSHLIIARTFGFACRSSSKISRRISSRLPSGLTISSRITSG